MHCESAESVAKLLAATFLPKLTINLYELLPLSTVPFGIDPLPRSEEVEEALDFAAIKLTELTFDANTE